MYCYHAKRNTRQIDTKAATLIITDTTIRYGIHVDARKSRSIDSTSRFRAVIMCVILQITAFVSVCQKKSFYHLFYMATKYGILKKKQKSKIRPFTRHQRSFMVFFYT